MTLATRLTACTSLLLLAPLAAGAQTVRVGGTTTFRYVEVGSWIRDSIPAILKSAVAVEAARSSSKSMRESSTALTLPTIRTPWSASCPRSMEDRSGLPTS